MCRVLNLGLGGSLDLAVMVGDIRSWFGSASLRVMELAVDVWEERKELTGQVNLLTLLYSQVQPTLQRFFKDTDQELYLLQVDAKKLGEGLIYELVEGIHWFPHFYGPSRSFAPLPLDAVTRAEKITFLNGKFNCSLLD
ncbi:ATP synthase subunit a [Bienertia sinuspersici]